MAPQNIEMDISWACCLVLTLGMLVGVGCREEDSEGQATADPVDMPNTQEVLDWLALKDWASRDHSHVAPRVVNEITYEAWLEQGATIRDVAPILNRLLERRDQRVFPTQVANALAFLGDASSVAILIDAAGSDDEYDVNLRIEAVSALGRLGDPRAIPRLRQVLKDDDSVNARGNAASSLGSFDTPEVREALQNALKDDSDFVRSLARAALAKLDAAD
jgi:HEAT repeat protein